jgi:hypothetical protein
MPASRYKSLEITDRKVEKSRLNQLIDIIAADISTDANRRTYPAFVTGLTTSITSSLFQTIFDQNHTYQSSNAMLDMTFGVYASISNNTVVGSTLVTELSPTIETTSGKLIFDSTTSLMMREKINIYKQYAQTLLGDANAAFFAPFESTSTSERVNEALFINVKRLFKRDNIYKGSFGIKMFDELTPVGSAQNLFTASTDSSAIMIIDKDGATNYRLGYAGEVGSLWRTTNLGDSYDASPCGLIFYDAGVIVLNIAKLNSSILTSTISGVIDFPDTSLTSVTFPNSGSTVSIVAGKKALGANGDTSNNTFKAFLKLSSIDDIIKHFCKARFSSSTTTAIAFQNETIINSTIFYCNASPDEFNYSTNPTYTDSLGKIQVVDDESDTPFSYITTVGLYNAAGELLAVAKLSRPIEKNPTHNLSVRVRLDY